MEQVNWQHIRFTGIIFTRSVIDESTADGVPSYARAWQQKADCVLVDIPSGILRRAHEQVKSKASFDEENSGIPATGLCAVFELYGETEQSVEVDQNNLNDLEQDMDRQIMSWSDSRLSYRTETSTDSVKEAELFHEDFLID